VIAIDLESDPVASGFVRSLARPSGNVMTLRLRMTPDRLFSWKSGCQRIASTTADMGK